MEAGVSILPFKARKPSLRADSTERKSVDSLRRLGKPRVKSIWLVSTNFGVKLLQCEDKEKRKITKMKKEQKTVKEKKRNGD